MKSVAARSSMPPLPAKKPRPGRPDTPEGRFLTKLDAAVAPLVAYDLPPGDSRSLIDALTAIKAGNLKAGLAARAKIKDAVATKLVDWYALRAGFGEAASYKAFLAANPAWPSRPVLTRRAEDKLFIAGGVAEEIMAYFGNSPPQTAAGFAALASAYLVGGQREQAGELARKAWRELPLTGKLESGFLQRFGGLLRPDDHKWRLDRILLKDRSWRARRRGALASARRLLPLLATPAERKKARARIAVYRRSKAAAKAMSALAKTPASATPASATPAADWGLEFQRAQLLRRAKKHEQAWKILLAAPKEAEALVSPDSWWLEKRLAINEALRAGKSKIAYQLAADPGPVSVNPRNGAAFLAGWLALRHLGDAGAAITHFKAMRGSADGPLSASKAAYWLARALAAAGDDVAATRSFEDAAGFIQTFHGQLARQTLQPETAQLSIKAPAVPTKDRIDRFNDLDAVKAAAIVFRTGLRRSILRSFFGHLRYHLKDEAGRVMLAHLAQSFGDTQMALRIGKTGVANGQNLFYYAYPVHAMPAYIPLRKPPEPAFLLAIARQESEFNGQIMSRAGARGILQVMPITARHICRVYKIRCRISRLITDQSYNARIASAYIADRTDEFAGSYVLTLTGFNAGPGRTRQWLKRYGDPRKAGRDTLDWIEGLPFNETRRYVMKVLSNLQVYRARLGDESTPLRLTADLARAKAGPREPVVPEAREPVVPEAREPVVPEAREPIVPAAPPQSPAAGN